MTPALISDMLGERLRTIEHVILHVREGRAVEADAFEIRAALLDVLDLVQRNPGIDAAVDDLFRSAQAILATGTGARQLRLLSEAHSRLQQRIAAQEPMRVHKQGGRGTVRNFV